jgi:hypothetical protein
MSRRDKGRSHSPEYIKGPPLRSEEKISFPQTPNLTHNYAVARRPSRYPPASMYVSCWPSFVLLTTPTGSIPNQRDVMSQYEAAQPVGMAADQGHWPETYPMPGSVMFVYSPPFLVGYPVPHDVLHEQWYSPPYPQYADTPGRLPEGPDRLLLPGGGENLDPALAVDNLSHGDVGPSSEDPGTSARCGTDPGGPIYLTTNISITSPQVSYPRLVKEVCRHSAWETLVLT